MTLKLLALMTILFAACTPTAAPTPTGNAPTGSGAAVTSAPTAAAGEPPTLTDVAVQTGLAIPWDLAFAPDGRMFVTERAGNILIFENGEPNARRLSSTRVSDMQAQGEAGLMGIVFDPAFGSNGFLYVCASRTDASEWRNQVLRYRATGNDLAFDGYVIREGMRAGGIHNGCRLAFGPDGKLWITMGEVGNAQLSQDPNSLNGKILRMNTDGTVPSDNPILQGETGRSAVYSMGHRNPQGLDFEPDTDRVFEIEHGAGTHDEINVLRPSANFGWPTQAGPGGTGEGFIDPLWSSGSSTLATSGGAFVQGNNWGSWSGSLFVATLKESDLRRFAVNGDEVVPAEVLLDRKYGRLRSVVLGPNNALFITTSNGTGDRIVRLTAAQ